MSGYASVKEYLRIHYNLLLEDFLYPIKQDLAILKNMKLESGEQVIFIGRSLIVKIDIVLPCKLEVF